MLFYSGSEWSCFRWFVVGLAVSCGDMLFEPPIVGKERSGCADYGARRKGLSAQYEYQGTGPERSASLLSRARKIKKREKAAGGQRPMGQSDSSTIMLSALHYTP